MLLTQSLCVKIIIRLVEVYTMKHFNVGVYFNLLTLGGSEIDTEAWADDRGETGKDDKLHIYRYIDNFQ